MTLETKKSVLGHYAMFDILYMTVYAVTIEKKTCHNRNVLSKYMQNMDKTCDKYGYFRQNRNCWQKVKLWKYIETCRIQYFEILLKAKNAEESKE